MSHSSWARVRWMAAMQTFARQPTERELACLLSPRSRSWLLRTEETADRLVARPSGFLLVWGSCWLLVPLAVFTWWMVREALVAGLDLWDGLGILMAALAALVSGACLYAINRVEVSRGDFFLLDKRLRVLTLSRVGCSYQASEIVGFVEVHAWHAEAHSEGTSHTWLGELTVLVRGEEGQVVRQPVVTSQQIGGVSRLAQKLADFFSVGLCRVRLDRKTRRRLA